MARRRSYGPRNYSNLGGYEQKLGSRDYRLSATVTEFVADSQKRLDVLVLQSAEDLINEVKRDTSEGGKMRVDTGFLVSSGQVSLDGMPSGPGEGIKRTADQPQGTRLYAKPGAAAIASLKGFKLGRAIYFGWTANYAKYREAYDGFLISGIQNWQTIVSRNCEAIRKRFEQRRKK